MPTAAAAIVVKAATNAGRKKMQPTKELIDQLYHERVEKARQMSPEDKFFGGARLFDRSCRIMADGIRSQFPDADDHRVQEILRERLALIRQRENRR